RLGLIRAANEARRQLESLEPLAAAPTEPDVARAHAAQAVLDEARSELAGAQARVQAARQEWERLVAVAEKSELLSQEADCPVCGQELGQAFKQVKAHRHQEAESARARLEVETRAHHDAGNRASTASEAALRAAALLATEQKTWAEHAAGAQERESARERWIKACDAAGGEPGPDEELTLSDRLSEVRQVVQTRARLSGRLARLADMEEARRAEAKGVNDLDVSLTALRRQVREMDFKPDVLAGAKRALEEARDQVDLSANAWHQAEAEAASQQARAEVAGARLADAEKAAVRIDDLAGRARNLGRLAELMNSFRNAVVSAIGPRLSVQAADLFAELTDKEYDKLEVDPNSYDIRITDQGHTYGMERFSGSETDLANLALRVAISEHLRFQSGGSVGLLVLDEVFGPLDEDRKVRMLSALERLKARFQQVLVVTHDEVIKEQLPNAIEVIKLPGRRAGLQPA
ncbi:MAG: ATP-binding protein, partial [Acidimicrobiales bacterium]